MNARKRSKREKNNKSKNNKCMATATKVDTTITFDDGTTAVFSSAPGTPSVNPSEIEVDVQMSDGTTKKFVPAP